MQEKQESQVAYSDRVFSDGGMAKDPQHKAADPCQSKIFK
jgi:hypothetical protein